ncbi:MAG: hypothetical protein GXO34_02895 [Deltaproteobacteria bacterium]|nr:hypothetical protein [Deltaproteobacteria bacterium]
MTVLLLFGAFLFSGCVHNPGAVVLHPAVDRGQVVFRVRHLFFSYNVDYSVGRLSNGRGMVVVGEIENSTTVKLENFKLELEIKDEKGRVLATAVTDSFPVDPDARSLFTFHVPTMNERVLFSFRCQFEYRQKSSGGYVTTVRDQSHFRDWIDFSEGVVKNPANAQTNEYIRGKIGD